MTKAEPVAPAGVPFEAVERRVAEVDEMLTIGRGQLAAARAEVEDIERGVAQAEGAIIELRRLLKGKDDGEV